VKEDTPVLDAESCAWMVRRLPDRISCIQLLDGFIIVGDWSGSLSCWTSAGDSVWEFSAPGRVSSITVADGIVAIASGIDVVALSMDDGQELWRQKLEGSADEVVSLPGTGIIHATSSVFDIEHGDFMESAYWRFEHSGDLMMVHRFDERPWHISVESDSVLLGLGRPRCGMLVLTQDGLEWEGLVDDDPVACGIQGIGKTVLGHSKGTVSIVENGVKSVIAELDSGIESISFIESGISAVTESGLQILDMNGKVLAGNNTPMISDSVESFSPIDDESLIWASVDKRLISFNRECQEIAVIELRAPLTSLTANGNMMAAGLEDGSLYIFQSELSRRRFNAMNSNTGDEDSHRSSMLDKLRRLRE